MIILVTGSNGFLGKVLCRHLENSGHLVKRLVRFHNRETICAEIEIGNIDSKTDWSSVLKDVDLVVHLAAQTPSLVDKDKNYNKFYADVNIHGTTKLVRACINHGVKRFIFISTAKVMGEGQPSAYCEIDSSKPGDAYAISKWEAEQALIKIAKPSSMEYVILRPPLIYGPGVKGNFLSLLNAIDKGKLLPLGGIQNKRSFLYLGNMIDAIVCCLDHPKAANQTYFVSDREHISTTQLITAIGEALHRKPRLFSLPLGFIKMIARTFGKEAAIERLTNSFILDTSAIERDLGWWAPYRMSEGLAITGKWYLSEYRIVQGRYQEIRGFKQSNSQSHPFALRLMDILLSVVGFIGLFPLMLLIYLLGLTQAGTPLFMQTRVGRNREPFTLVKFRTMRVNTQSTATHLVDPQQITRHGAFLRKTKLDELPQLWNVLKGEMSLVGPRPCLPNQVELIDERERLGVFRARPGITGLAQIQGIDMANPVLLASADAQMLNALNLRTYFYYIAKTLLGAGLGDRVRTTK